MFQRSLGLCKDTVERIDSVICAIRGICEPNYSVGEFAGCEKFRVLCIRVYYVSAKFRIMQGYSGANSFGYLCY